MINTTKDGILFIQTDKELNENIIAALRDASKWLLEAYGLQNINLSTVTTKNHLEAALSAHIEKFILRDGGSELDEQYVRNVFAFTSIELGHCPPELYAAVTRNTIIQKYRKAFLPPLRRGFSVFLVALHIRRAIVLPHSFKWPVGLLLDENRKVIGRRQLCPVEHLPELLRLMRSLDYREGAQQTEEVFNAYSEKQRERLVSTVHRLIVTSGWLEPADANYEDMLALKVAHDKSAFAMANGDLGLLMLADLLERKYGDASPVNGTGWRAALRISRVDRALAPLASRGDERTNFTELAVSLSPANFAPEVLTRLETLPGLSLDAKAHTATWCNIQQTLLKKWRLENKKSRRTAIGYFNIYLFGYLVYWYDVNPDFQFNFPSTPQKLVSGVFVSDLGLLEGHLRPLAFVEFLEEIARTRKWEKSNHYGTLKQIEKLFEFIEKHDTSLPKSKGFRQPLHQHDYPNLPRQTGTKKRPIPRRVFRLFLSYIEALVTLSNVLLERVVAGEISDKDFKELDARRTVIDCFERQNIWGFIPVIFYKGKTHPLRYIPNIFYAEVKRLKHRGAAKIPHPHLLHQIIVALYTGLRHNHIQWLDEETFDSQVDSGIPRPDFARLYVNTDKTKANGWTPFVNFRVIEILRQQKRWKTLIDEPRFDERINYNNNPDSKWGSILPLFSFTSDGRPHSDSLYTSCWYRLLGGLRVC